MDQYRSNSFHQPTEPISFSFEQPQHLEPPERFISKCFKLKTNQSFDDRPIERTPFQQQTRKSQASQQSESNLEHCLKLAQEEYELRIQSLVKQYELRLSKQEQFYGLREWKLKQELQNLALQNNTLTQQLRKAKIPKPVQTQCSLCSDGQILSHYNKIISENEQHHKGCLKQKKELNLKIDEQSAKLKTLEQQYENICQQLKNMNKIVRNCQSKVKHAEQDRDKAVKELAQTEQGWKQKYLKLQTQAKEIQKQLHQKSLELKQSQILASSVTLGQNNSRPSLKSSYLKGRDQKQDKQYEYTKGRSSLNKITPMPLEDKQNHPYCKKINQNIANNKYHFKYQPIQWKYF